MTALADPAQLYDPALEPWAWFTMPMLMGCLVGLALGVVAAVGMAVAATVRLNRATRRLTNVEDHQDDMHTWAAAIHADIDRLYAADEPPTEPAARVLLEHALGDPPHPRTPATAGRHAHPEED